jgi:diaminohydroxyphosphoribosylaminopyrimidine deaminase / 5-amino-6-(5-phosphoribosylamino)uracil reductase
VSLDDARHMAHALALGRRGMGNAWPNPSVGAVLVREGRIVGRGWTQPGGRPHAERMALDQAGAAARGATAYVTLEPCAHHGATPPCAEALIAAGIARVVTAIEDPDPRVSGRGLALLRAAGLEVTLGTRAQEAAVDLAGFLLARRENRPLVTLKLATSLDGRIATASGQSQWITGPMARRRVHALRMSHDAVMVGAGTARADDPLLTVRDMGAVRQPVRVVLARHLKVPLDGRMAASAAKVPLWLLHGPLDAEGQRRHAAWAQTGATLFETPLSAGQIDPRAALARLAAQGLTRIFCEGGGQLAAALIAANCVDHLVTFCAGLAIGAEGLPAVGALGLADLTNAPRWTLTSVEAIGGDTVCHWSRP